MFEKASKLKLRFNSEKGLLTTEDLWDLSLSQLNVMAKALKKELKNAEEEDFLGVETKEDAKLKLSFDLVLHVLNTKKAEVEARKERAERKVEVDKLKEILAKKREAGLESLSEEEILKRLEALS